MIKGFLAGILESLPGAAWLAVAAVTLWLLQEPVMLLALGAGWLIGGGIAGMHAALRGAS